MLRFFLNRIQNGAWVLLGVVCLIFAIFSLSKSDPSRMLGGQRGDEETLQKIRKELLLDKPLPYRFGAYLNQLSPISIHFDNGGFEWKEEYQGFLVGETWGIGVKIPFLGKSFQTGQSVNNIIKQSFPETAILAISSMVLALILGGVLAFWKTVEPHAIFPRIFYPISIFGMALPSFFMAMLVGLMGAFVWGDAIPVCWPILSLALFFFFIPRFRLDGIILCSIGALVAGLFWNAQSVLIWNLPGTGLRFFGSWVEIDPFQGEVVVFRNLWLPMLTLAIRPLSVFFQLIETTLQEEIKKPYFNTALSKGLSFKKALGKHVLPNALGPIVTTAMGWIASLLAGAVFIEFIFGWKGLGLEIFEALEREDQPVIVGLVLFFSVIFVLINIVVDWVYMVLDPRIKEKWT